MSIPASSSVAMNVPASCGDDILAATTTRWPAARCALANADTTVSNPPKGAGLSACIIVSEEDRVAGCGGERSAAM